MIELDGISTEFFEPVSFKANSGDIVKIIVPNEFVKNNFLYVLASLKKPSAGRLLYFGNDVYSMTESARLDVLKAVGIAWNNGGLLSNLKVWENIMLPSLYHLGISATTAEVVVEKFYKRLGKSYSDMESLMSKGAGNLPNHEKMLAGVARSILLNPDIIIYDNIFSSNQSDACEVLAEVVQEFHNMRESRVSVFVATSQHALKCIKSDIVINIKALKV